MNRPYTAHSPYSLTPTEVISTQPVDDYGELEYEGLLQYPDDDEYADYAEYDEESIDRRWMWIAGIAGVILFIAIGTTGVILGGGDSGSVTATGTSSAPTATSAPATTSAPAAAPVVPSLPAETVTTVSPTAQTPVAPQPEVAAPPPPPPVAAAPRTVTYRVTGTKPLIDFVTVIYTDQQGALQTEVNVALPWAKSVVLDPGVELKSVTATSVGGQLNCGIYDASGALIAYQSNNSMIATCTQ